MGSDNEEEMPPDAEHQLTTAVDSSNTTADVELRLLVLTSSQVV